MQQWCRSLLCRRVAAAYATRDVEVNCRPKSACAVVPLPCCAEANHAANGEQGVVEVNTRSAPAGDEAHTEAWTQHKELTAT